MEEIHSASQTQALENLRKLRDQSLEKGETARGLYLGERTQAFLKNEGEAEIRKRGEADRKAWKPNPFLDVGHPDNRFDEKESEKRQRESVRNKEFNRENADFVRSGRGDYKGLPDLKQLMKPTLSVNQKNYYKKRV